MRGWTWVGLALGAATVGAILGKTTRHRGLGGIRNEISERDRRILGIEIEDAERRAYAAGAEGELEYIGAGMEGIVFCDERDRAFKVARSRNHGLQNEAKWFRMAAKVASLKPHVPKHVRYDAKHAVLVRECVRAVPRALAPRKLFELHERFRETLAPYGYGRPEFKEDAWVMTRRGPVIVDAGFAARRGVPLVQDALALLRESNPHPPDVEDMGFALRWERGETVPAPIANRLLKRLQKLNPAVEI